MTINELSGNSVESSEEVMKAIDDAIEKTNLYEIECKLGLPSGFYKSILKEADDWGFLIKLTVILESALSLVIVQELRTKNAKNHVDRLSFQGKTGKLGLARDLEIIDLQIERRFEAIFQVRNAFAHRLSYVTSTLSAYAGEMTATESSNFFRLLFGNSKTQSSKSSVELDEDNNDRENFIKKAIWIAGCITLKHITSLHNSQKAAQGIETAHQLFGQSIILRRGGKSADASKLNKLALEILNEIKFTK